MLLSLAVVVVVVEYFLTTKMEVGEVVARMGVGRQFGSGTWKYLEGCHRLLFLLLMMEPSLIAGS